MSFLKIKLKKVVPLLFEDPELILNWKPEKKRKETLRFGNILRVQFIIYVYLLIN